MAGKGEARRDGPIERGRKEFDGLGTLAFVGSRLVDPFVQYQFLKNDWGRGLIERLKGTTLPAGPPLITRTPLDRLGLSPYRTIILAMSVGSMLKQNYWVTAINQEKMPPGFALQLGAFNMVSNMLNTLFFVCAQTSASANGEHFPQTPLIVGSILYGAGILTEWFSEEQRHKWKKNPENKGDIYTGGLWSLSRHINYFGYAVWRTGYALAAGGWAWGAATAALSFFLFTKSSIPEIQQYLEQKYGEKFREYERKTPYCFVPYLY